MSVSASTFEFVDVNPGIPGLSFAARSEGGACIGVVGGKSADRDRHAEFFPSGGEAGARCDFVFATLPFSMFAYCDGGDPAVNEPISIAAKTAKKASAILFRVSWAAAQRLGVDPDEYRAAIEGKLGSKSWEVTSAVSDDRNDLFVAAVARKKWNGREALPMSFPAVAEPESRNGDEILIALGYPEDFAAKFAGTDRKAVAGIVNIDNARTAISAVKAALK
ncbi:hypothetical protein O9X98_10105 [Agrobacterium salinitolerans]|nr:hypothetical protein [Agrobacterium salinitolerans]